jgi:hypothetical protein
LGNEPLYTSDTIGGCRSRLPCSGQMCRIRRGQNLAQNHRVEIPATQADGCSGEFAEMRFRLNLHVYGWMYFQTVECIIISVPCSVFAWLVLICPILEFGVTISFLNNLNNNGFCPTDGISAFLSVCPVYTQSSFLLAGRQICSFMQGLIRVQ